MWTHTQTGRVREELSPLRGFIEPNEGETARLRECVASSSFVAGNCWVSLNIAGFFFFFFSKGLWLETRVWKKAIQGGQNSDLYPLRQPGGNKIILLVKIKMCLSMWGHVLHTRTCRQVCNSQTSDNFWKRPPSQYKELMQVQKQQLWWKTCSDHLPW